MNRDIVFWLGMGFIIAGFLLTPVSYALGNTGWAVMGIFMGFLSGITGMVIVWLGFSNQS